MGGAVRYAAKRDLVEPGIFDALKVAGREPIRCTDFDIAAKHVLGHGVMLELKTGKGRLREIQTRLAGLFKDRYRVVRSVSEALKAVGVREV